MLHFFMRKFWARAKNDAGERIESLRFSVPALRVGVLEYAPGQLQTNNTELEGKTVKLYYPPEAVSDQKFLKSLETAPVVVGGHDSTTNEQNKKIDGWAHDVSYDEAQKAAMISGVVKGAKEVAYIKSNLGSDGFGASAFVDICNLKVESGMTPDGEEYNAIAGELKATHVALAPNVRDPQNKIKVTNAVVMNPLGTMTKDNGEKKMNIDVVSLTKSIAEGVKNAMAANAGEDVRFYDDMKDKIARIKSDRARVNLLRYLDNYKNASDKNQKANYAREVLRAYETERYKES